MEITKVVKPFIRRGWPNTFGNIVHVGRYSTTYCHNVAFTSGALSSVKTPLVNYKKH